MAVFRSFLFLLFSAVYAFAKEPEVNCPAPRSPEHGQTFLHQGGSVVRYACEPGYVLIGRVNVRCIDGQWEEPIPFCFEVSGSGSEMPLKDPTEPSDAAPVPRPLFDWNGENENVTSEEGEKPQGDEARLRMVIMPRRRARLYTSRVARLHSASELEEEEKKRSSRKDDRQPTTIHLETPPSMVYVRRTVTPGKLSKQEQTLQEQYRTAAVHMTMGNKKNGDTLRVVTLPRAAVSSSDKGDESLRHLYWTAQQYYPRSASVEYRSGSPVVMTLSESQMAWINSLHPELRDQYLRDLYVLRAEEAAEESRALSFLRRYDDGYNYYIRQPLVAQDMTAVYDYSCNQADSHFVTAPKLPNAHVARYDRRQNPNPPYNHYLTAVYRCDPSYVMLDNRFIELTCSKRQWIGTEPICVPRS